MIFLFQKFEFPPKLDETNLGHSMPFAHDLVVDVSVRVACGELGQQVVQLSADAGAAIIDYSSGRKLRM